jgi:ATP-binding cassette subfamily C protein
MSRMQREYQRMVTSESAYWSMQAAIEGAPARARIRRGRRRPCCGTRSASRTSASGIGTRGSSATPRSRFPRADHGDRRPVGRRQDDGDRPRHGALRPQEGEVWIDELPLQRVDWRQWRRMIGYVPQETILLHDTGRNNVTLAIRS